MQQASGRGRQWNPGVPYNILVREQDLDRARTTLDLRRRALRQIGVNRATTVQPSDLAARSEPKRSRCDANSRVEQGRGAGCRRAMNLEADRSEGSSLLF